VKIGPSASEKQVLESQSLEIFLQMKKKTSAKYIALPASLPSRLNKGSILGTSKWATLLGNVLGKHSPLSVACE